MKTCANVLTFDPSNYDLQMSLYHWIAEENTQKRFPVEIEAVDKNSDFARSKKIIFTQETLMAHRAEIIQLIEEYNEAMETGLFMRSSFESVVFNSPYYGHPEYGRWTEPEFR